MKSIYILNIHQKIFFLFLLSILYISNSKEQKIFTLQNDKILMVSNEGIFFFTSKMNEEESKRILFDNLIPYEVFEEDKIIFEQFSIKEGGYFMLAVTNIIYFFDSEGYLINFVYLGNELKSFNYTLIPYKQENNFLYYIITYPEEKKSLIINQFKFNLNYPNTNQIISFKTKSLNINTNTDTNNNDIFITNITNINCIIKDDSKTNKDVLVCFYVISFPQIEIQTKFLDIKNGFNEISNNFRKFEISEKNFEFPNFVSVISDENCKKILIYLNNGYTYIIKFDLENLIYEENTKLVNIKIFSIGFSNHKLFKVNNSEIIIMSSIKYNFCKLYILNLDSDLNIIKKEVIDQDFQCKNINLFSSFTNGSIYTIINSNNSYYLNNLSKKSRKLDTIEEKCATYSEESKIFNLCLTCKTDDKYYKAQTPTNITFSTDFVECYKYKVGEILDFFYFDEIKQEFIPCYETCTRCNGPGNEDNNNCLECAVHYRKSPKFDTDCVASCTYFYYYTFYGQYKCTEGSNCPEEAPLYIFEKKKCIDDCKNDDDYQFQYGGRCYQNCPGGSVEAAEGVCIDDPNNSDKCLLSSFALDIQGETLVETVDVAAQTFSKEFSYTNYHISYYFNDEFSFVLYQEYECVEEKNIDIGKMDFGDCESKARQNLSLSDDEKLIVALVQRKNENGKSISIFYFYDPETGNKVDTATICSEDKIVVKKSVTEELNNTDLDYDSMLFLTEQNIDIFHLDSAFYKDICFHFESPNGKDVPLKDRILAYYPNISLCEDDCESKGVNLTSMESICECDMKDILNNDLISGNALLENTFGEIGEFITNSNLDILKCYKDVFSITYIKKNIGGLFALCILGVQIILTILFFLISMKGISRYLTNLSEFFSTLIVIRSKDKNNGEKKEKNSKEKEREKNPKEKEKEKSHKEKDKDKVKVKLKIEDLKNNPPKKEEKDKVKKKNKEIRETEQKEMKKSLKSINKFENNDDFNTNLNSQISFDKLYKGQGKFRQNILKKIDKKDKNENINNNEIEIFKLKDDKNNKKDVDKEIKKIQDKYGVDEEDYLRTEFDDMEFDDAVKYDNRTFCEYFWDKLKENQIILNTFINPESLKPVTIKVILLLLNIELYFVINGLFFSESYISELFHSEEEEKFFSYFTRSISRFFYTPVVGVIISTIMDCILIEEKKVKRVFMREKENHLQVKKEISLIIKSLKKNYIIFISICYFISLLSWYYLSCFNNVYPGVKVEWIKSSITIIIIMQVLSFLAGLLVAIIRLVAFKCNSEKLYKLKDFFN